MDKKILLSMDGKTFYGADKPDGNSTHVEGLTEAEAMVEMEKFPKGAKVKYYELTELP